MNNLPFHLIDADNEDRIYLLNTDTIGKFVRKPETEMIQAEIKQIDNGNFELTMSIPAPMVDTDILRALIKAGHIVTVKVMPPTSPPAPPDHRPTE